MVPVSLRKKIFLPSATADSGRLRLSLYGIMYFVRKGVDKIQETKAVSYSAAAFNSKGLGKGTSTGRGVLKS
jgi:hypothetical protein